MLFSELYSTYYKTVAEILAIAVKRPVRADEITELVRQNAFGESVLTIPQALSEERWQLIGSDGTTPIRHRLVMPLTTLQKQWINAIANDPRIKLFGDDIVTYPDEPPLFTQEDYCIFDKYADGDNYTDADYIANFRLILDAVRNAYPLEIEHVSRNGSRIRSIVLPQYIEYSEKDDKFRLIGDDERLGSTINVGRILNCNRCDEAYRQNNYRTKPMKLPRQRSVIFELYDARSALERVLLHFAHYKKEAEKLDDRRYRVTLYYNKDDETEILIRLLSFGPMIKVVAPEHFIGLIKHRLTEQKKL